MTPYEIQFIIKNIENKVNIRLWDLTCTEARLNPLIALQSDLGYRFTLMRNLINAQARGDKEVS